MSIAMLGSFNHLKYGGVYIGDRQIPQGADRILVEVDPRPDCIL